MWKTLPSTTLFQAFEILYTRFLLRDFVGKVIPGLIFLALALSGSKGLLWTVKTFRHLHYSEIFAISAIAWLFALCSQSINSRISHFYFPCRRNRKLVQILRTILKAQNWTSRRRLILKLKKIFLPLCIAESFESREKRYQEDIVHVYDFFSYCTPDQKAQYERFVVIKEASANSFFCTILGLLVYIILYIHRRDPGHVIDLNLQKLVSIVVITFWLIAAHLMKIDNLYRQTSFLEGMKEKRSKNAYDLIDPHSREHRDVLARWIADRIAN